MKSFRVIVFDQSASIRALLRRTVGDSDSLICSGSHPTSTLLEDGADLEGIDAVVIGLNRGEAESWPALAAHLNRSRIPAVVLSPTGDPGLAQNWCPERCHFLDKPRSPKGWEALCSTLVAALEGMKIRVAGPYDRGPRFPGGLAGTPPRNDNHEEVRDVAPEGRSRSPSTTRTNGVAEGDPLWDGSPGVGVASFAIRSRERVSGRASSHHLKSGLDLIAVGGSAGGPNATGEMLKSIGEVLERTAVVVVQHISVGFESGYVQWLSGILPWADIAIAEDGEELFPGRIRIAGPGAHLGISEGPALRLDRDGLPDHGHRPSVDRLFQSLARSKPEGSAGVLLSGMGIDGVEGLLSLKRAGCLTLVQDRESSAVFGMPRAALERGAATIAQPPAALGKILKGYIEAGKRR